MTKQVRHDVDEALEAAHQVLRNNLHGGYGGLPRTAAWGYPEPYTRDLLISGLAALVTREQALMASLERVLEVLAQNQSPLGHIPSLVHDPERRGASDTTPLFLVTLAFFRRVTGQMDFLRAAAEKALRWMDYQSPENRVIVQQQPTTDWRDEQWVPGYGLYVNTLVYAYLRLFGEADKARLLYDRMHRFAVSAQARSPYGERAGRAHVHPGLVLPRKPYFAFWSFKEFSNERFDLMGNSLAILSGLATPARARWIVSWVERSSKRLRARGVLAPDLPPCIIPFVYYGDPDYQRRSARFSPPGCYLNGGVWPFVCAFYAAALVAAGRHQLARRKLAALTDLVRMSKDASLEFGFNEWHQAQTGRPKGEDWQSWSAAMYIYAAKCVRRGTTPLFDDVREG